MTYVLLAIGNEGIRTFSKGIVKCQENNSLYDTLLHAYLVVKEKIKKKILQLLLLVSSDLSM